MKRFTETSEFIQHVARLNAEVTGMSAERLLLAGIKRAHRTDEQHRQFVNLKNRIETSQSHLDSAEDLSSYSWSELLHLWFDATGGLYDKAELDLFKLECEPFEGRGEKPIRSRLGLSIQASNGKFDLPNDEEIKYVGNGDGDALVRISQAGTRAYGKVLKDIIRTYADDAMSEELWECIIVGEVSAGKVYSELPELMRLMIQRDLSATRVLGCYSAIYVTTDRGFARIPSSDYAKAWSLACVTQMSPKYRLKREYVEEQLRLSASSLDQKADIAA